MAYRLTADLILIAHALFVGFVVLGLPLIVLGVVRRWGWVRNPWFRWAHLGAIMVVVVQAWLGLLCPLTVWENSLRARAGETAYAGSFVRHWLHRLIFFEAESWVFTLAYTLFGGAVVAVWLLAPPRRRRGP